jgi:outer membrane receptor protein involved in Fe transport
VIVAATSNEGSFTLANLPPGLYSVSAELSGFKRAVAENVLVNVSETTRVSLSLEVGSVTETVEVQSAAALIRPESAVASTVLTAAEYENLPLAALSRLRIPTDFALLTPGVLGGQQRPGRAQTATTSISVDGSAPGQTDVLVDGMSAGQVASFGSFTEMGVPVDAIQEFNVIKGAFSAEYGYVRTGLINFSLKSGTNALHASFFEYFRNRELNARSFFEGSRLPFNQNNFGGTFTGPMMLPKLYRGKDRTFFMFSSDTSLFRGTSQVVRYTSPTEAFLRGDFSALRTAAGAPRPIYDPTTNVADGRGGIARTAFPNNTIPASRIDPISRQVAALYPLPNSPGIDANFGGRGGATFLNNFAWNTKLDHRVNDRHSLSGSFNYTQIPRITTSNPYEGTPLQNGLNQNFGSRNGRLTYDLILSPRTLNHLQLGYNRYLNRVRSFSAGQDWPNRLNLRGVGGDGSLPVFAFSTDSYPQISSTRNDGNVEDNLQFRNVATLIRGRHNWKIGFESRYQRQKIRNQQNQNGTFSFSSLQTALNASNATGNSFASFLLGFPNQGSITTPLNVGSARPYYAAFIQDDLRLTARLTLNLGLRYDLDLPPREQYDRASIFDLATPNPAAGNLPGALLFLGSGNGRLGSRTYETTYYRAFAPRFGLAYQWNAKTVLRGGYATSYSSHGLFNNHLGFNTTANFVNLDQGATAAFQLRDGMPTQFPRPPFIDPAFGNRNNVTTSIRGEAARMPRTHLWRLDIQRELPGNTLFEVAYTGTRGTFLNAPGLRNLNQVPASALSLGTLLTANVTSPAAVAAGIRLPFPGFTGVVRQALRPYPQVLTITSLEDKLGSSSYHALESKLQKRFSAGLQLLIAYTFSKNMTNVADALAGIASSGLQNAEDRRAEWAVAGFDTPHNWRGTVAYELPFGPGKRFLSQKSPLQYLAGGWTLSAITTYQSGLPLRITQNNTLPLFNTAQRPNLVAGVAARNPISYGDFDPAPDRLFAPAAFSQSGPFAFGNASPRLAQVRDFGVVNEDLALRKNFRFGEKFRLEFGAQAFNLFNRNQWGSPADNLSASDFGKITLAGPGRFVQLNLKLIF